MLWLSAVKITSIKDEKHLSYTFFRNISTTYQSKTANRQYSPNSRMVPNVHLHLTHLVYQLFPHMLYIHIFLCYNRWVSRCFSWYLKMFHFDKKVVGDERTE